VEHGIGSVRWRISENQGAVQISGRCSVDIVSELRAGESCGKLPS
jgi:hypothetical protein